MIIFFFCFEKKTVEKQKGKCMNYHNRQFSMKNKPENDYFLGYF